MQGNLISCDHMLQQKVPFHIYNLHKYQDQVQIPEYSYKNNIRCVILNQTRKPKHLDISY